MNKEVVKKGYQEAEKELEEKQIEHIKDLVKRTLVRIKKLDEDIKELEDERRILKLDIEDLKNGHLDRIEQRQSVDKKAKELSVFKVVKVIEHHHHYDYWTQPYTIKYEPAFNPFTVMSDGSGTAGTFSNFLGSTNFTTTCSVAKNNVIGTYPLGDKFVHLR